MRASRSSRGRLALGLATTWLLGASAAATGAVCGDADGDGRVTDTDAVVAFRHAAGLPTACAPIRCDVDDDGTIGTRDARDILRKASGLPIAERCGLGTVAGRLFTGEADAAPAREREPNDLAATATALGHLTPGAARLVVGRVDPSTDPFDGYTVLIDTAVTLDLRLRFRRHADADLLITDPATATALSCESTAAGRERCRVTADPVGTARTVHVVVAPAAASQPTPYVLTIRALEAEPGGIRLAPGRGAAAPRALAPRVYAGREAEIVPGELIVMAPVAAHGAPPRSGAGAMTHARQALAAARLTGTWRPAATAPVGATLCVHTDTLVAPADPKHARGALRRDTLRAIARLNQGGGIRAQPNYVARAARTPNDPLLSEQWHYRAIGLEDAWDLTAGDESVIVAVVDSGIRSDHPEFAGKLVEGYDFITDHRRANDGDGRDPDPFDPGDRPGSTLEGSFHGTHVAGTIAAATDNATGVAGVAWRTRLMPLRVLGVGGGSTFDIAEAIRFAAGLENVSGRVPKTPAAIVNLSLVALGDDPFMRAAVDEATAAGALVIAAAGNTASDLTVSPAVYENSLAVTASDALGVPARYAAFGPAVDLVAPGGDTAVDLNADGERDGILSTLRPGSRAFQQLQGTSMAAAHVSGVAALVLARAGAMSPADLRTMLLASAADRGTAGRDDRYGFGLVDPVAAIRVAADLDGFPTPVLTLDTDTLAFGDTRPMLRLHVRNAGGGTLTLGVPVARTHDGLGWLRARLDPDPTVIALSADRRLLVPGTYTGEVVVASNGGSRTLAVGMEVPDRPPVDVGPVTVTLLDADDGSLVAQAATTFAEGYGYRIPGVRGGPYQVHASTDRDGDAALCDPGELCGAFPTLEVPRPVSVRGGSTRGNVDFVLGPPPPSP